jgi:hypothetical protein
MDMLTFYREIEECSEFLRRMSLQWETARHCHMTLLLLSTKIKDTGNDPESVTSSYSYALRSTERAKVSLQSSNQHDQARWSSESHTNRLNEQSYPPYSEGIRIPGRGLAGHGTGAAPVASEYSTNLNPDASQNELSSSQALDFQNMGTDYLACSSGFDLNMVDLFGGSNFDSLLDMMGQQYPSF